MNKVIFSGNSHGAYKWHNNNETTIRKMEYSHEQDAAGPECDPQVCF
jgi:hypothetical protein